MSRSELNALLIRLVVTFVQGFLSAWGVAGFRLDKVALGGAIGVGASLVYNLVIKPQLEKLNNVSGA